MSTLELHHIGKSYQSVMVLDRIDLHVPPGSRTAIVGPSGSGKRRCCGSLPVLKHRMRAK